MTEYNTVLELTQKGKNGPISTRVRFDPQDTNVQPEAYTVMTHLTAMWANLHSAHEPDEVDENAETYRASFSLRQEVPGGDVYSVVEMSPKLKGTEDSFPTAYGAISYLATQYLIMAGVISEEGDIISTDELGDTVQIHATSGSLH